MTDDIALQRTKACRDAAKWWRATFSAPCDQIKQAGLENPAEPALRGMLDWSRKQFASECTVEMLDKFEQLLFERFNSSQHLRFGVDYDPDAILVEAADAAGMPDGVYVFPFKTWMVLSPTKIHIVSGHGHGRSETVLWEAGGA